MHSDSLQDLIYEWLSRRHPDGPEWHLAKFHCFNDCHPLIRSLVAMDAVEGEIANGAWGQLLWNTFPNWRTVLELAGVGYASMGAKLQQEAIPKLHEKLAAHEQACREAMQRAETGSFDAEFGTFTSIGYSDVSFKAQMSFLDENLTTSRSMWLERNRDEILKAIP